MKRYALSGIRILSLAEQLPGPYATLLLADMGAEVILVERPQGGDPARLFPDFFASTGRNKRSLTLDLKSEKDRIQFYELVKTADAMLEGYSPGAVDRLGIAYDDIKALNENIIYVSISGYGQTGPYRNRKGHDLTYQAAAGLLGEKGQHGGLIPTGDMAAGLHAAFALVTALYARKCGGPGTYIDVSITDSLLSLATPLLGSVLNGGTQIDLDLSPAYGIFQCKDRKLLTLGIAHENHLWDSLCRVLETPEYLGLSHLQRVSRDSELRSLIRNAVSQKDRPTWGHAFDRNGIPWSPVLDLKEAIQDSHFQERGLVVEGESNKKFVRQPAIYSSYDSTLRYPVPALGEANETLGRAVNGLSPCNFSQNE